ncbi:MAG TPA: hypothetical protein VKD91_10030 [Pyrinomonadaceae bacterium]|nr:hypothetical protein [Pyrinomonadaceae bacterium]
MRLPVPGVLTLVLAVILAAQDQASAPGDIKALLFIEGSQSVPMKDITAASRSRWGVVTSSKQYFIFQGARATLRARTTQPVFEFDADPSIDDPVYLFRFDRRSDRREITVAKGFGGLADFSLPKDHIIATSLEEIGTGSNSTRHYRLKPTAPLHPGEYCVSRNISVCFDFGVD